MAGILGGSGSHVVQIIVVVIVAVALIGYFVVRIGRRSGGSGDVRAVAAPVSPVEQDANRAGAEATGEATVRLVRMWTSIIGAPNQQWDISMDGVVVGAIANSETVDVGVDPGHHILRLGSGRHRSAMRSFDVAREEVVAFSCHGPRIWPMLLAALINPSLWISLRRN